MHKQYHGSSSDSASSPSWWGGAAIPLVLLGVVLGVILLGLARMGAYDNGTSWGVTENVGAFNPNQPVGRGGFGGFPVGGFGRARQVQNAVQNIVPTARPTPLPPGFANLNVNGSQKAVALSATIDDKGLSSGNEKGVGIFHPLVPNPCRVNPGDRRCPSVRVSASLLSGEYGGDDEIQTGDGLFATVFEGRLQQGPSSVSLAIVRAANRAEVDTKVVVKDPVTGEDVALNLDPATNPDVVLFIDGADGIPQKKSVDLPNELCGQSFAMVEFFDLELINAQQEGTVLPGYIGQRYIQANTIRVRKLLCTSSGVTTVVQPAPVSVVPRAVAPAVVGPVAPSTTPSSAAGPCVGAGLPSIQTSGPGYRQADLGSVRAVNRVCITTTGPSALVYVFSGQNPDDMKLEAVSYGSFPLGKTFTFVPPPDARYIRVVTAGLGNTTSAAKIETLKVF